FVLESEAKVVGVLDFAEVVSRGGLVVAELERAAGAGVPDVGDAGDLEPRDALIVGAMTVRSVHLQYVGAIVAVVLISVCAEVLACIAEVAVKEKRVRNGVSEADGRSLHSAASVARIAAEERVAPRNGSELQRCIDVQRQSAVASPDP